MPKLAIDSSAGVSRIQMTWHSKGAEKAWLWVLQTRRGGAWSMDILPGWQNSRLLSLEAAPEFIALTAVDRVGNQSASVVFERQAVSARN